jgi:hypothetical protein
MIFVAAGVLSVNGSEISFRATKERKYRNVKDDLQFNVRLDAQAAIGRFFVESPVFKRFSWWWITLRSPELEDEVLLCVGGTGRISSIVQRTDRLFQALQDAQSRAA